MNPGAGFGRSRCSSWGCLLFFALAIFGALPTVGTASTALTVCALVVVVMFIIALFLWATVFLYGRPERFVPPWLRDLT
jgi:hypothetical protein